MNALVDGATGGTGVVQLLPPRPDSAGIHSINFSDSSLARVDVAVQALNVSGLDTFTVFDMLAPSRGGGSSSGGSSSAVMSSHAAGGALAVSLLLELRFVLRNESQQHGIRIGGPTLVQHAVLSGALGNWSVGTGVQLGLDATVLGGITTTQFWDPPCLARTVAALDLSSVDVDIGELAELQAELLHAHGSGGGGGWGLVGGVNDVAAALLRLLGSSWPGVAAPAIRGAAQGPLRAAANTWLAELVRHASTMPCGGVSDTHHANPIEDPRALRYGTAPLIMAAALLAGVWLCGAAGRWCSHRAGGRATPPPPPRHGRSDVAVLGGRGVEAPLLLDSVTPTETATQGKQLRVAALGAAYTSSGTHVLFLTAIGAAAFFRVWAVTSVLLQLVLTITPLPITDGGRLVGHNISTAQQPPAVLLDASLIDFSAFQMIKDFWAARAYFLTALLVASSIILPLLKLLCLLLMWCWALPPHPRALRTRGWLLLCLDLTGRSTWSIDVFLCFVISVFRLDVQLGPAMLHIEALPRRPYYLGVVGSWLTCTLRCAVAAAVATAPATATTGRAATALASLAGRVLPMHCTARRDRLGD